MLEAVARIGSEVAVTAGVVPLTIFQYFGESVLGVTPDDATPATGTVTFTMIDTAGYTIDAGTQLDIDGVGFTTDIDLVVAPGNLTGSIAVSAIDTGTAGNDLVGAFVDVISPTYTFVETVELDAPTAEGLDGETGEEYADRLADELPTLSPKAILIEDFEALARRNTNVGRALAIDNYNPTGPDPAAEGHVTVVVHDLDGEALSAPIKAEIEETLEGERVLNLSVHVLDPTYTTLDVTFTATAYSDYDPALVEADAIAAVTAYFDPATWGDPTAGSSTDWIEETTVYRDDLVAVVKNVAGVRHVTGLTLAEDGDTLAEDDVVIVGPGALPRAGTIDGTVT